MDEEEYEYYLKSVFGLHECEYDGMELWESIRDDDGEVVPGCYYTKPAGFEQW